MRFGVLAAIGLLAVMTLATDFARADGQATGPGVPAFDVRPGYRVTLAAEGFGPARFLEQDDHGTLFVSQPSDGTVTALRDADGDGIYETKTKFLTNYPDCHGMCWHDGWLYVTSAREGSCRRFRSTKNDAVADETEVVLPPGSVDPGGGGHPFRGIIVTDQFIFMTVSDPRNMSDELPSTHKCVYRFDRDGKNKMQFTTGIRNTEKIRFRPGTEEIYGLDHGTDNFGGRYGESKGNQPITDELPGEELNHLTEGGFFGHPFISNNRIVRPEYADRPDIVDLAAKTTPPAWVFGAHWAGNGFTFLDKDYFPDFKGDLIAAFHGSWNSSVKVGYRVERVLFDKVTGVPFGSQRLVSTLTGDGRGVLARPVDCAEAPDGTILFSCDMTKKIYRISKAP